jgi:hypothetical protein
MLPSVNVSTADALILHPSFSLPKFPREVAQAAGQDLHQPVAEWFLLRQHALETELLLHAGTNHRRDQRVRDLGRTGAVAHEQ